MFLKEHQDVSININNNRDRTRWKRKLGITKDGVILMPSQIRVPWYMVRKHSMYRTQKITVQCDDCGKLFARQLISLDPMFPTHYCDVCRAKGTRGPGYKAFIKRYYERKGNA